MNTTTIYATLVALPMLLIATGETFAWSKSFSGTRDQVRAACAKQGGDLVERAGSTSCASLKTGNHVTCSHTGQCEGGGPGPMPRTRTGMIDLGLILGSSATVMEKPKFPPVPESLTSGNSDGGPSASAASSGSTGRLGIFQGPISQGTYQPIN